MSAFTHEQRCENEVYRLNLENAALRAKLDAALASPVPAWSSEKPTKPGWYWYRPENNGLNSLMCWVSTDGVVMFVMFKHSHIRDMDGEWVGPLQPPQEGGAHDRG